MNEHTPPILRKAPLQSMVCELRFPARFALQDDATRLQQALSDDYPLVESQAGIMIQTQGANLPTPMQRFAFVSVDGGHAVLLTPATIALECRSNYEGWQPFCERWQAVVKAAAKSFEDLVWQQRIGLRYINQLDADGEAGLGGMVGRVNPELLHPLKDESGLFRHINSSFQELRVPQELGVCTVRHGLRVDDEGGAAYVLDFDYYDDEMTRLDIEAQIGVLKEFNLGVWNMFRWCLTEDQFLAFEPEDRE